MHWLFIVLVTLVHMLTTEYQYTAQGSQNDIHPLPGLPPLPHRSIRFVTLNVGGPFLARRRWGRLLQEVSANEPAIVGLREFRFCIGDNHLAWTAGMAKNHTPVSYSKHNPDSHPMPDGTGSLSWREISRWL